MTRRALRLATLWILVVVTVAFGMDTILQRLLLQAHRSEQRATVQAQTGALRAYLEELIASDLRIIDATAAYIAVNPDLSEAQFRDFARRVSRNASAVQNLAAAPDLVIRYVYPREGNESILGVDYRDVPDQLPLVLRARDTGDLAVAGPLEVLQGGMAVLGRAPVFTGPEGREEFWGVVSSLISFPDLVSFMSPIVERYQLKVAIRGVDGLGPEGAVFYGDPALFEDEFTVLREIAIPNGTWQLAAAPAQGWETRHPQQTFIHLIAVLLIVLVSVGVVAKIRQDEAIATSEHRLRDITFNSSDLVWETDRDGVLTHVAGYRLDEFGGAQKLLGQSLFDLSRGRERTAARDVFLDSRATGAAIADLEVWVETSSGEQRCHLRNGVPRFSDMGAVEGYRGVDKNVTVRRKLQEQLEESVARMDLFFRQSLDGFFFMMLDEAVTWNAAADTETTLDYIFQHQRITRINQAMLDQYGAREEDFLGMTPAEFFQHDPVAGREVWRRMLNEGRLHVDTEERRVDGSPVTIEGDYIVMYDRYGRVTGHFGIQRDVTALRDAEAELERYIDIVDRHVIISQTDLGGTITSASDAFARVRKKQKGELLGKNHRVIRHPDMPDELFAELWDTISRRKPWHGTIKNSRKDGTFYWVEADVSALVNRRGNHYGYMAVRQDISAQKELEIVSVTDRLTGLYNRQKIDTVLEDERQRYRRYGEPYSIILLDIDHFKAVNDTHGHPAGDRVLQAVAEAMRENLRASDVAGRWGGEEFIVVCPHTDLDGSAAMAENLRQRLEQLALTGVGPITGSFGVATVGPDTSTETLIHKADQAMYEAKQNGRNQVCTK